MNAVQDANIMWVDEDVAGAAEAALRFEQCPFMLEFHAGSMDDACISRILAKRIEAVILTASSDVLERVRAMREAAPAVAVVLFGPGIDPTPLQALREGVHEFALSTEPDRLPEAVGRALARVQAEQRLNEHQDRLRALFNTMSSGVIVTKPDGRVIELNAPALRYLNLADVDNVVDQPVDRLLPGLGALLRDTPLGEQQQAEVVLADGDQRTLGFTSAESPTGRYRFTLFRDLTPTVRAERRRRRAEQLAQVGEMAARLSHEIKNPLASVLAGLELLLDDELLGGPQRAVVRDMTREARTLSRTVQELLSCARESNIAPQRMRILPLVEDAVRACRTFAEREGVELAFNTGADRRTLVVSDAIWLRRALINLVINAIEATGRGGKVIVEVYLLKPEEKRVLAGGFPHDVTAITVRDDGPGVPRASLDRVFEPFFTTKSGGTGLGLSVAMDAIESLGGVLTLSSTPGRGSTFSAFLPGGDVPTCWEAHACPQEKCTRCIVRTRGTGYACWAARALSGCDGPSCRRSDCTECAVFHCANLRPHWPTPVVSCTED